MSAGVKMGLPVATRYAERIAEALAPFAVRIEIAGSIRRRRPEVHDVDLVIIPRDRIALEKRALQNCDGLKWGNALFQVRTRTGVQVDLYYAHEGVPDLIAPRPSNWGSVLLCRTGSVQHNVELCQAAEARGWRWVPRCGVLDEQGRCVAAETEAAIFAALGRPYAAPEERER